MDDHTCAPKAYLLSPEQMTGPYLSNPKLIRRNISEGLDGIPLVVRLTIVDAMTGEPVTGAIVDIGHCTDDDTSLRGGQITDQKGIVRFTTIYPGFHAGCAPEMLVAVRVMAGDHCSKDTHVAWVGRLYFPDGASPSVIDASTLKVHTLSRDSGEDGFFGHMTLGIDTFAESSQIKPEDFDKYAG
ncbi:MAG: intradiol ring-cleavage dioxygenase [Pseudomonas sp.]|nr:intradiol ring-cleavage dioxygenase [Pseudomonas sp.]